MREMSVWTSTETYSSVDCPVGSTSSVFTNSLRSSRLGLILWFTSAASAKSGKVYDSCCLRFLSWLMILHSARVIPPLLSVIIRCSTSHRYRAFALVLAVDLLDTDLLELVLSVLAVSTFSARVICKICKTKGVRTRLVQSSTSRVRRDSLEGLFHPTGKGFG